MYHLDNFYLENEAKLLKSLFSVDNYLGKCVFSGSISVWCSSIILALLDEEDYSKEPKTKSKRKQGTSSISLIFCQEIYEMNLVQKPLNPKYHVKRPKFSLNRHLSLKVTILITVKSTLIVIRLYMNIDNLRILCILYFKR